MKKKKETRKVKTLPVEYKSIRYKVEDFVWGRREYVTECPYGIKGRYTGDVNKVGDIGCNSCTYQIKHFQDEQKVVCSYKEPEVSEDKKLFKSIFGNT